MISGISVKAWLAANAIATRTIELDCDRLPFRFEKVGWRKLLNWLSLETSIYARSVRPWGLPTHIQVEPCNLCNLRCRLCPVTDGLGVPTGVMDFDLFQALDGPSVRHGPVDAALGMGRTLRASADLRHDRVRRLEGYQGDFQLERPSFRGSRTRAQRGPVRAGHADLRAGRHQPGNYERYRQGGKLETVLNGIRNVVAREAGVGQRGAAHQPSLHRHEVQRARDSPAPAAGPLTGCGCTYTEDTLPGHDCDPAKDAENPFIPANPDYQRFRYSPETGARIRVRENLCKHLWNAPSVRWDGKLVSCGFDIHESRVLGDLTTSAFRDIWYGTAYQDMRREFRHRWDTLPICSRCSYAWEGGNCARETVHEAVILNS
jgi:radical SAM protein with 4Fe4S-binding SPASM domain